jgi:DUF971 family protein
MSAATPLAIDLRPSSLRLQWADGAADLTATELRAACRCGGCRAAAVRGEPHVPADDLRLAGAEPVGQYAVQLIFSDGHDRGIYPWELLHAMSPTEHPTEP